jgi:hypothetical protein
MVVRSQQTPLENAMKLTHSFARPTSSPIAAPAAASFRFPRVKILRNCNRSKNTQNRRYNHELDYAESRLYYI